MSNKGFAEKRRFPRVSNNVPLKITAGDADFVTETTNISCAGAYCKVNKYLEPMTKLQITLLLPIRKVRSLMTKKVTCGGVVIRTENILNEEGFHTAIFFNDIQPKDSRTLAEFVDSVMNRQKPPAQS